MAELKLPSGITVKWRDVEELKQKDRSKIIRSANGADDVSKGMSIIENTIAVMVESWSVDLLPPSVKIESLGELSLGDYDLLQAEAQKVMSKLFQTFEASNEVDSPLPNSND